MIDGYAINEKRLHVLQKTVDIQTRMLADALNVEEKDIVKTRSRVLRAGFGSASADKFLSESVRILAELLTQSELVPRLS
ncbi:hypothetical protein SAMN02910400_01230 [Lachnospiraceae bacterium C10]|nr:hypothetical protein SAMN02910400_01230 [Lachnospiraceae bacterium C10]SDW14581.1 hypothetical protein SAMN05216391_102105 [Lachnospiraceae bacterium KHCPX20]